MIQRGLVKECRCGAKFEFIPGPHGDPIPVSRVKTLYTLQDGALLRLGDMREQRLGGIWVSHLETCPKPEIYSKEWWRREG